MAFNDDGKGRVSSSSFGEPLDRACGIGPCPISLDFGANSTKVSFVNIEEQDREEPHDTHQPRILKWKSFRQWVQVTLLLPLQVNQTCTPTLQYLESDLCRDVMFKLLFFTFAMILLPLGTYWFTFNYIFEGLSSLLFIFRSRLWWIDVDGRV